MDSGGTRSLVATERSRTLPLANRQVLGVFAYLFIWLHRLLASVLGVSDLHCSMWGLQLQHTDS